MSFLNKRCSNCLQTLILDAHSVFADGIKFLECEIEEVDFSPHGENAPWGAPRGAPRGKSFDLNNHWADSSQTLMLDAHSVCADGIKFWERVS